MNSSAKYLQRSDFRGRGARLLTCLCLAALTASTISASSSVHARAADRATWLLASPDVYRLPAPPAEDSVKTRKELRELRRLQDGRTKSQRRQVRFWNGGPVTAPWTQVALKMVRRHRPRPALSARALALLHAGLYDALVAARDSRAAYRRRPPSAEDPRIRPLLKPASSSYPADQAVVAGTAEVLLTYLFPNESPETFERLANKAAMSRLFAGTNYRSDVSRGRRLGRSVAADFLEFAAEDGHTNTGFSGSRPDGEGTWQPTPPGYEDPIGGAVGTWKPWTMTSPSEARTASALRGPLEYGSLEFMEQLQEVREVQSNLTAEQASIAIFWDDAPGTNTPPGHWNAIALDLVRSEGLSSLRTAELFAVLNVAQLDGAIAFFEAKYEWWSIRPITAMRRLCDDGARLCTDEELAADPSRATYPDWEPYILTPPFPSYPSGHATFSGAAGKILETYFPTESNRLNNLAEEAALSRLYGGIHFRLDNDMGLVLGRQVAEIALQRGVYSGP